MFSIFPIVSCLMIKNPLPLPHVKRKGRRFSEYTFLSSKQGGRQGDENGSGDENRFS
jgi:hypothetical protein